MVGPTYTLTVREKTRAKTGSERAWQPCPINLCNSFWHSTCACGARRSPSLSPAFISGVHRGFNLFPQSEGFELQLMPPFTARLAVLSLLRFRSLKASTDLRCSISQARRKWHLEYARLLLWNYHQSAMQFSNGLRDQFCALSTKGGMSRYRAWIRTVTGLVTSTAI